MPHIHEKYDFTIGAFIVFNHKVLLVNHPRYQTWLAPGGHVELDEDPEQALFREIEEETGFKAGDVEILSSKPPIKADGTKFLYKPNYLDAHYANPPHRHISLIYFAKSAHANHVKSYEHTEARWFTNAELEDPKYDIWAVTKFYAKEAIKSAQAK
jgi:8-oxo-dGTP diphosphatase